MSESRSTIDTLFETPRNLVDRTIETQESINRQGLDLTRSAVKPIAGFVPGDRDADEQVDDAIDTVEEQQSEFLEGVQSVADRTFETSEDAAEWGFDLVDQQVGRLQRTGESAEDSAEDALETAEETTQEVADTAGETAEDALDSAGDVVDEFRSELDEAADEFESFDALDDTAVEGLVEDGIETVSDLASAQAEAVADATEASTDQAEEWIDAAVEREDEALADLDGIGDTYADRLAAAGIRTVDQLARTSADEVATSAEVGEERAAEWIQQAQDEA